MSFVSRPKSGKSSIEVTKRPASAVPHGVCVATKDDTTDLWIVFVFLIGLIVWCATRVVWAGTPDMFNSLSMLSFSTLVK